jgi:hypothetical protein
VEVLVDNAEAPQTMEVFGAMHLPLVYQGRGDTLSPKLRSQEIDMAQPHLGREKHDGPQHDTSISEATYLPRGHERHLRYALQHLKKSRGFYIELHNGVLE